MSFGRQYSTPIFLCRRGFIRANSGLVVNSHLVCPLYRAFLKGHRSGDPKLQRRLIGDVLLEAEWHWPWLEKSASKFSYLGIWPAQWHRLGIANPLNWHAISFNTKIELLSTTLSKFAFIEHNWHQCRHPDLIDFVKPTLFAHPPCEASVYMVSTYNQAVEFGEYEALPPYFPMDMVSLHTVRRHPRRS